MKTENQILNRINRIEEEIKFLLSIRSGQMSKNCRQRDYGLLDFVSKEVDKYEVLLTELNWIINKI